MTISYTNFEYYPNNLLYMKVIGASFLIKSRKQSNYKRKKIWVKMPILILYEKIDRNYARIKT